MSENHQKPEVPEEGVPVEECLDGLAKITVGLNKCSFTPYDILGFFGPPVFSCFLCVFTPCIILVFFGFQAIDLPQCQERWSTYFSWDKTI